MINIHNGDVVATMARRADVPGEHVSYRESLVTGPVVPGDQWVETRARALASAYGLDLLRARTDVLEQEQFLDAAPERGEIVLWFEHDLYCLVHLVHLLDRFAAAKVSVVWCPEPLGEKDERALHLLFESRAAAGPAMIGIAREVWRAYTAADPSGLNQWVGRDTPDFPFVGQGMTLHASRFPSVANGLGAIEQRALAHIAAGVSDFLALFDHVASEVPVPLSTITGEPPKALCSITPAGENVLRGDVDDIAINDPDHWLGGTHLAKDGIWRWDGRHLRRN
jgi:hypothetical protein